MSIMSLINLKKDFDELKSNTYVVALFDFVKGQVVSYVDKSDMLGADKKAAVVTAVVEYISTHFLTQNTILAFLIKLLVEFVPELVQAVFNYLKTYVAGLTSQA